jgi:hypothetical protein
MGLERRPTREVEKRIVERVLHVGPSGRGGEKLVEWRDSGRGWEEREDTLTGRR